MVDLTDRFKPDGSLDWVPPSGRWRILRMGYSLIGQTNHPAPAEATGLEVDKYEGPAVRRYLDHYLGMYRDAAGADHVGKAGVRALVADSIQTGASNWTPRMLEQFKRLRGYDAKPWLPALTGALIGSRAQSDRFLYDYRRTLSDLIASEHYGTLAKVAHENDLVVYGEAFENGRPSFGDDLALRSHADVPMAALWTYGRAQGPNPAYLADMKGAASVAHIYGQNLVAAESMTAMLAPWAFGPADLKRVIDLEFVTGVNRPVVHTSVHAPTDDKKPGLSLGMFGQYFNRHESWAELARPWTDYIARNALMLQQGRNVADVAYFYGEDAPLTSLYATKAVADAPRAYAYDFINADALTGALTNDGDELAAAGGARYRAVYLGGSSRRMTLSTLRRLASLVNGGAKLIGLRPEADPGMTASQSIEWQEIVARLWPAGSDARVGNGRVIASTDVEAALHDLGVAPDFHYASTLADSEVLFVHRQLPDGDSYFLNNRKDQADTIEAHFRVDGKVPELWRPETGSTEPLSYRQDNGETVITLALMPEDAVHVVFRRPSSRLVETIAAPEYDKSAPVNGPWHVTFEQARGAPAAATFSNLTPLNENLDPGIRYFSGIATYTNTFKAPLGWRPGRRLWLDLGEAKEIAEVTVNGKRAGYTWHSPYRIDIGNLSNLGRNNLQIRVANLWVNRLIGDAQPSAKKITWTASPTYTAKAPLRRSGLIGPVTLAFERSP